MIVSSHGQRPAMLAGTRQVGVAQHVSAAVNPGALAVPDADDSVDVGLRQQLMDLASHHRRCGKILVHARNEVDIVFVQQPLSALQGDIITAQRRTFVAGDEGARSQALAPVAAHLFDGQPHQRLNAAHVNDTFFQCVLVVERKRSGHGRLYQYQILHFTRSGGAGEKLVYLQG